MNDDDTRAVARYGRAVRQFSLTNPSGWEKYREGLKKADTSVGTSFFSRVVKNPEMETILRQILIYVRRDFVSNWFNQISPNTIFPYYIDYLLHYAVAELYGRILNNLDLTQLILGRVCGILTNHIQEYQNAERLLRASRLTVSKDPEEFNRQLSMHYLQGKLHPALTAAAPDTIQSEYSWLRKRLKPLVPLLLPRKEASSGVGCVLSRELLITCLIRPAVNNFAQPDYWNQLGETYGGYFLELQTQRYFRIA